MVGSWPQLVASFDGQPGLGGDALEGLPVGGVAGLIDQSEQAVEVTATREDGSMVHFVVTCRIDTPVEIDYYRNGGILHTVLRQLAGG